MRAVIEKLERDGPCVYADLPYSPKIEDRLAGVRKFDVHGTAPGTSAGMGCHTPVYYLDTLHDPEDVLPVWLEANHSVLERTGSWSLFRRICEHGGEWRAVAYELLGPFQWSGDYGGNQRGGVTVCSFCGEEFEGAYRDHLPCDGVT